MKRNTYILIVERCTVRTRPFDDPLMVLVVKSRHFLCQRPHVDFMEQFTVIGNRKFVAINRN